MLPKRIPMKNMSSSFLEKLVIHNPPDVFPYQSDQRSNNLLQPRAGKNMDVAAVL